MIVGAFLTIAALVALYWKFGEKFRQAVLGYDIVVDVTVTAMFLIMFAGTISGMMIAILSGLIVSLLLLAGKALGTSRTVRVSREGFEWTVKHGVLHKLFTARS
jgi:hypothetical protein